MKRSPIQVFSEWADLDKDFGMEKNHKESVENMLSFALKKDIPFSFIDAGCGNGWVVREVAKNSHCTQAIGVDGSEKMIEKAKSLDPSPEFYCADLMKWTPQNKVTLVHSMEVFYYLENPEAVIKEIYTHWLEPSGRLIVGIDFYLENPVSHEWSTSCGISGMKLFSEKEWIRFFDIAGYHSVKTWRVGQKENWAGTLVITGLR
jgi:trans-aconitate methyltransferase